MDESRRSVESQLRYSAVAERVRRRSPHLVIKDLGKPSRQGEPVTDKNNALMCVPGCNLAERRRGSLRRMSKRLALRRRKPRIFLY